MTEITQTESVEIKISAFDVWIDKVSAEGKVENLDPGLLRDVLENCGANFEIGEAIVDLSEYTNKAKAETMRLVWENGKYDDFKKWVEEWADNYEVTSKTVLPKLEKSGSKTSGMIQFFGQLTSYAAGQISFVDFKLYTETRALNGRLWQEGRKNERIRVRVPTSADPIRLSSFPSGFPSAAWEKIKSWRK